MTILLLILSVCGAPYQIVWIDETGEAGSVTYEQFLYHQEVRQAVMQLKEHSTAQYRIDITQLVGGVCA